MANYTPTFSKPYPSGWVDKPSKTTPATAAIMNSYDTAIAALEAYLRDNAIDTVSVSVEQFPSDGRQWLGTITVGSNQYRIYMPSLKYENSVSDGIKIGTVTLGEQSFDVYAPTASAGGSTVSVVPKTLTGTNIAEITVDGTIYQLYAPTSGGSGSTVTAEATLKEGTQIGKITIDGVETILYAPTASTITVDAELSATSENAIQNKAVKAEFDKVNSNLDTLEYGEVAGGKNLIDYSKVIFGYELDTGNLKVNANWYVTDFIPVKPNTTYTISGTSSVYHDEFTQDKTFIEASFAETITTSDTTKYLRFNSIISGYSTPQLEEGATATEYEPYIPSVKMLAEENAQQSTDLSNLKDGTTPVAKAVADEDGNNIKSTYAKKTEAFIDYSHISVDLNTLTTAPSLISIGYEATNKPSGFYGGYMFVVNAGYSASIALYQTLLDVFNNKTFQRKYYHGTWTDWEQTNSGITIDSALSENSTNPVQNKIITAKLNEVFQSVSNGKSLVASAITDKGITTAADATFQTMATNIGKINSGSGQSISNVLYTKNCNKTIFRVKSKIKLSENPTASNISLYINDTLVSITEFEKTNDYEFHIKADFSTLSDNDSVVISTNSGLYFDSKIISYNVLSVILTNPIFVLPKPQLYKDKYVTQLYTHGGRKYYAAADQYNNEDDYWAISMIAVASSNYVFPIVVSNNENYAHATTSWNFGTLTQNYELEYDGKTYYFSYENPASYKYSIADVPNMGIIVPLYPYDGGFSDNLTGGQYIATKLLNLYYNKEDMPSTIILPTTES